LCVGQTHTACDCARGWVENVLRTGRGTRDFVTRNEMSNGGGSHEES
jgi:hypothetical protein